MWSPKLYHAWMTMAYWKITLSSIRTKGDAWDRPPHAPAKEDVIAKLRDAQQAIRRTIQNEATQHQSDFLQGRAAAEALAGNKESAKVV